MVACQGIKETRYPGQCSPNTSNRNAVIAGSHRPRSCPQRDRALVSLAKQS